MDNTLRVGAVLESLILEPILRPLTQSCDAFGDYGAALLAQEIAKRLGAP